MARSRVRRRSTGLALGVLCALGAFGAVGCGAPATADDVATLADSGTDGTTPPTTAAGSTDPEEAMRQFAACMREHGIDMQDPQPASGPNGGKGGVILKADGATGGGGNGPSEAERTKMETADKECRHFMEGIAQDANNKMDPAEEAKMKEQALAFAACMREHGVDMPDPQFSDGGVMTQRIGPGSEGGSSTGIDPSSPAFVEAQEACSSLMPEGAINATAGGPAAGEGPVVAVSPEPAGGK